MVKYKGEREAKSWYILLFMARSVLMSMLFQMGIWFEAARLIFWVAIAQVLYVCLLLLVRPYTSAFHNVRVLLCEFTILYSLALALLPEFISVSEMTEIFLIFILEGAIIICTLLAGISLGVIYYRYLSKRLGR